MTAPDTDTLAGLRRDNERWQTNSRETWQAMSAMRDSINEYIPMPSAESDLLQGPDNSVFCDTIARSVIAETIALRAQAATNKARIERLEAALREILNCGQSAEPDHWKFRCMARETARAALEDEK